MEHHGRNSGCSVVEEEVCGGGCRRFRYWWGKGMEAPAAVLVKGMTADGMEDVVTVVAADGSWAWVRARLEKSLVLWRDIYYKTVR